MRLVQHGVAQTRAGTMQVDSPSSGVVRRLRHLPYVAVCLSQTRDSPALALTTRWLPMCAAFAWLAGIVWLASRFLARGFLLPMHRLAHAGSEVARGEYRITLDEEQSGREFQAISRAFNRMTHGLREGRLLSRFVSSQATSTSDQTEEAKVESLSLGGDRRTVIVMFSHVADFVRVTAHLNPHQIMEMLNQYFSRMEPLIERFGGRIDKYIGDAIMAVFPTDESQESSLHAIQAALAMRQALAEFNRSSDESWPRLTTGIGMAEGEVIAGRVGSRTRRLDYTVIGDVVNLAARLEALRERLPAGAVIINETLATRVSHQIKVERSGYLDIKGKVQRVPVFFVPEPELGFALAAIAPL
ncbi:MAG TPA: adenylate/guanylate cyclase domain-containing protein, partial [Candidatus Ozemobacteraceae bacterium]|nr:adenylate/guanylate cyclase domain-containing protein [Candidatus Ozemobacteraceae bacterium]